MTDHDRLFKELLTTFFAEFVELFLPDVSEYLDPASIEFLDKELFTDITAGESHVVDLLVRAKVKEQSAFFLIHLEHQSSPQTDFGKRMFRYFSRLYEKHDLPIYPVVLFSYDQPQRPEPDHLQLKVQDRLVLDFWYHVIQLNQLSWRDFARQHNPLASALMAKMKIAPEDRIRVKLECLRLLTTLHLDPAKERLISGFIGIYLELAEAEELQYMEQVQELPTTQKEEIMELMTSWERKGMEQGIQQGMQRGMQQGIQEGMQQGMQEGMQEGMQQGMQEGMQEGMQQGKKAGVLSVTQRLLRLRVGSLPAPVEERLHQLSIEKLELLSEASFGFATLTDIESWLSTHS